MNGIQIMIKCIIVQFAYCITSFVSPYIFLKTWQNQYYSQAIALKKCHLKLMFYKNLVVASSRQVAESYSKYTEMTLSTELPTVCINSVMTWVKNANYSNPQWFSFKFYSSHLHVIWLHKRVKHCVHFATHFKRMWYTNIIQA